MVVVFSHQGGCCQEPMMLHIHNIHLSSHTSTRTLRMIDHRIFPRNIMEWGQRLCTWWHLNLLLLIHCSRILLQVPLVKIYQALRRRRKPVDGLIETEEKILIELFGENEEKLRYKAYNSPEWKSIAKQLHETCRREHVSSDKTAQQCKNKISNLTKKYKTTKHRLRTTGYVSWIKK